MPPPKKKSRKGLFIVLGVILVVAMVGCVGVAAIVNAGGRSAQQAVNQTSTQIAQLPTTQPTTQPTTKPK
jgi:flagellar basal body-associated protein FliL